MSDRNIRIAKRWDELSATGKHGHYETLFQVVNEEIALLSAPATPSEGLVESASERIYEAMVYDEGPSANKPKWVPKGNSRKQEEARDYARAALSTPATSRPLSPARPPQVAELVKIGREFYEAAIEAKPEVIVSSALLMRASDLIDRLATALAAQGDGE